MFSFYLPGVEKYFIGRLSCFSYVSNVRDLYLFVIDPILLLNFVIYPLQAAIDSRWQLTASNLERQEGVESHQLCPTLAARLGTWILAEKPKDMICNL